MSRVEWGDRLVGIAVLIVAVIAPNFGHWKSELFPPQTAVLAQLAAARLQWSDTSQPMGSSVMLVAVNKVVTIDFTLYDENDNVLESSRNEGPLAYLHGGGELPEGLESELEGKQAGDEVHITLPPEEAYGDYDDELRQNVPREQFEGIDDIAVGMRFEAETEEGPQVVRVVGIEGDDVIVDANEPYAGMTVRFDVKVLGVRDASESELEYGHVHNEHCNHDHDHDDFDDDEEEQRN